MIIAQACFVSLATDPKPKQGDGYLRLVKEISSSGSEVYTIEIGSLHDFYSVPCNDLNDGNRKFLRLGCLLS